VAAVVWIWDELLYDRVSGRFDVDGCLTVHEEFGDVDAVTLWHAYPVIGLDPRNRFDAYHDSSR
jgi:hypothetical protein